MSIRPKSTTNRMVMVSMVYFMLALTIFTVVIFAWYTLTDINRASLVSQVSGVEAEYAFYVYRDSEKNGSNELTLIDNVCILSEDLCYEHILNPTSNTLIPSYVAPGERFSFAIKITSVGETEGYLALDFKDIVSAGYDIIQNKIQIAFLYELDKVSYINEGVESIDYKDSGIIIYYNQHFDYDNNHIYSLISNVPFGLEGDLNSTVVIYFDLYFDPTIYGQTSEGVPYTNSNIFMNQIFAINHIVMTIY
ncbi:MAG: hypothetical protein K9L02_02125 [Acholeplasmataceae bacterium]|nr:hypothetical protein [Acholeplasmataceae bacterium]